jgi:UDP-glucose:tetrahydrobiopterin glucosyltransferase
MSSLSHQPLKLLVLSTPVGPLGSGLGGGVELTLKTIAQEMLQRGHSLSVVSPVGSEFEGAQVIEIEGTYQTTAQTQARTAPIVMPANGVLANMWAYAHQVQTQYDLVVNFAYDWLPFYLTPFFKTPIAHFISMGSLNDAMDAIAAQISAQFPGTIGVYTQTQADTFAFGDQCRCLGSGIDLSQYEFGPEPGPWLAWMGRISPEKGLEDAVAAAQISQIPLKIMGKLEDADYWQHILQQYPHAPIEYLGFLSTQQLQQVLRECRALLMTHRWIEAFGNVAIEALACGVPVIAYRRGGPAEIVQDGKTGWLVEPDSVEGLVTALSRIDELHRPACRQQAETQYSLSALGDRFEQWFYDCCKSRCLSR